MKLALINPNLSRPAGDLLGSGVPYMPVLLAYIAGNLKKEKIPFEVIDAFGESPEIVRREGNFWIHGLNTNEILQRIDKDISMIAIYGQSIMSFDIQLKLVKILRKKFPNLIITVLENTQAVTAYSLKKTARVFLDAGVNFLLAGESDRTLIKLWNSLVLKKPDYQIAGLIYRKDNKIFANAIEFIQDLNDLPFPAWEYFPLKNYWKLGYAHGPVTGKYLTVLTSRGCPYNCAFCVVPATNYRRWRFRSPKKVVDELEYLKNKFKLTEFHLEDLNSGMNKYRLRDISLEINRRELKITWKIVAGTKIEHLSDKETLYAMRRSGCKYISISPESGSPRVLRLMNKPFDHKFALQMVQYMHKFGIISQACFVLGFPGETSQDLTLTEKYIKELTKIGIDEIALFIMTPIPGTATFGKIKGYKSFSELSFSPSWREDYHYLSQIRLKFYIIFLLYKAYYYPTRTLNQLGNILKRHYETKMEMVMYRTFKNLWLQQKNRFYR